ncbi:MAG: YdeI/OmpD-associated family protein [Bryobacteraceae bacterium]
MPAQNRSAKIDAYIAKAQPFARPILMHLRNLLHQACPEVEETIKWSQPFFVYRGAILCNMAAFKAHCNFHFWGKEISGVLRESKALGEGNMSSFDRITSLSDLPADDQMLRWIRQAGGFVDNGQYTSPMAARPKKPQLKATELPVEFKAALKKSKKALAAFEAFSPSCKREYIEWIAEAKRPETREKRIATAVEWIAEGKQRNWKYQNC